jgi:hypothetical protein
LKLPSFAQPSTEVPQIFSFCFMRTQHLLVRMCGKHEGKNLFWVAFPTLIVMGALKFPGSRPK